MTAIPKTLVLVLDHQGAPRAIGPVTTDEAVTEIRDAAEEYGWELCGEAVLESAASFRKLVSRRNAA